MRPREGQEVRFTGHRGLWRIVGFYESPAYGPCARLWRHGQTRIIPLDKLKSKSGRPLEARVGSA